MGLPLALPFESSGYYGILQLRFSARKGRIGGDILLRAIKALLRGSGDQDSSIGSCHGSATPPDAVIRRASMDPGRVWGRRSARGILVSALLL